MNIGTVTKTVEEARRFLTAANAWTNAEAVKKQSYYTNPKEAGALRRASMDLTRALAEMRKPG